MRITYVYDRLFPTTQTDAEQAMSTVAALRRRGADVTLMLPSPPGDRRIDAQQLRVQYDVPQDVRIELRTRPWASNLPARKLGHALLSSSDPLLTQADVVYTRNALTFLSCALHGLPVAYDTHRAWPDQVPALRPLFRTAMRRSNFLGAFLHSELARRSYLRLGVAPEALVVARNGFDPRRFAEPRSRRQAREHLGLDPKRPLVCYTGHLTLFKGVEAVYALARACPDVGFLLVGSLRRGCSERLLRRLSNVRVLPWQPFARVVDYLRAADVLLIPPSRIPLEVAGHTVLPMKVYGYLAAGRPILAPATPDLQEVLVDGVDARLVRPGAFAEAAAALRALIDDPATARRLGEQAFVTGQSLTWDARARTIHGALMRRLT